MRRRWWPVFVRFKAPRSWPGLSRPSRGQVNDESDIAPSVGAYSVRCGRRRSDSPGTLIVMAGTIPGTSPGTAMTPSGLVAPPHASNSSIQQLTPQESDFLC